MGFIHSLRNRCHLYVYDKNRTPLGKRQKKSEENGGIKAFLLGLGLGTIGYAILSLFAKPRCPNCDYEIDKNVPQCPKCGMYLQWK